MNLYIIVEGDKTELSVYPSWIAQLAPQLSRIEDAWEVADNNYYLFSGGGIPHIYSHIVHAVDDISGINAQKDHGFDYLLVCLDTEESNRAAIEQRIQSELAAAGVSLTDTQLVVCEQQVCMETWFLGNRHIFKSNPQSEYYRRCIEYYDVSTENPELMGTNEPELNRAHFHHRYLKEMFKERHMQYAKNNTTEVQKESYLKQLIARYTETGHLSTFGHWYEFITSLK